METTHHGSCPEDLLKCPVCKEKYNFSNKIAKVLFQCGHNICEQCLHQSKDPQDQDTFLCRQNHLQPQKVEFSITQSSIMEQIQNSVSMIYCGAHRDRKAEYFNVTTEQLVCLECAFYQYQNMVKHEDAEKDIVKLGGSLLSFSNQLDIKLVQVKQQLEENRKFGQMIVDKKQQLDGQSIVQKIKHSFLFFQENKIEVNFKNIDMFTEQKKLQFAYSSIAKNKLSYIVLLNKWIDSKFTSSQLIYRGSTQGFKSNDSLFQNFQTALIAFVETVDGFVFGGFLVRNCNSYGYYRNMLQESSFIFSLTHQTKHLIFHNQTELNEKFEKQEILNFGKGKEFVISQNCNQNENSHSNIGFAYYAPSGITHDTEEAKTYLAGKHHFRVKEVEVFSLS